MAKEKKRSMWAAEDKDEAKYMKAIGLAFFVLMACVAYRIAKWILKKMIHGFWKILVLIGLAGVLFLIAIVVRSLSMTPEEAKKGGESKESVSAENEAKLKAANQEITNGRLLCARIKDLDIASSAKASFDTSERIIKELREQPDQIRTAHQFLNYYLPTLNVILEKYKGIESKDMDITPTKDKMMPYLSDISKAMERQYDALFEDETLDLTVEMEAMQIAFKRDGLLSETEIPTDAENRIDLTL